MHFRRVHYFTPPQEPCMSKDAFKDQFNRVPCVYKVNKESLEPFAKNR